MAMMVLHIRGIHATGPRELSQVLNRQDETISRALRVLEHHGLVGFNGNRYAGWYLTGDARQLPLMRMLEGGSVENEKPPCSTSPVFSDSQEDLPLIDISPKNSSPKKSDSRIIDIPPLLQIESEKIGLPEDEALPDENFEPGVRKNRTRESEKIGLAATSLSSLKPSSSLNDSKELLLKLVEARKALEAAECSPDQIVDFTERFAPDRILHACDVYDWAVHTPKRNGDGNVANDRGYLISFLTRNWTAPKGYIPKTDRCPYCYKRRSDHAYNCPSLHQNDDFSGSPCRANEIPAAPGDLEDISTGSPRSVSNTASAPEDPLADQTWLTVLEQLQLGDMPRGQFESYVKPLRPMGLHNDVFEVECFNPYARDWCISRLSTVVSNLLTGIYVRPVTVKFRVVRESGV
jgi:hypothetical protein